jgi:hypothetical protein
MYICEWWCDLMIYLCDLMIHMWWSTGVIWWCVCVMWFDDLLVWPYDSHVMIYWSDLMMCLCDLMIYWSDLMMCLCDDLLEWFDDVFVWWSTGVIWLLAGLHKVHPAYRMVNAGRAGVFNRVPTLCNQLLPHLQTDILQTLHSCYRHIEDVHVTFWKYSDIFRKISM